MVDQSSTWMSYVPGERVVTAWPSASCNVITNASWLPEAPSTANSIGFAAAT
jgi:hypothetical protein